MPFARKRARTKPTRLSFSWRDGCRRWRPPGPGGSHVSQETVDGMKEELDLVGHDPNAVFFYSFVQARAKVG